MTLRESLALLGLAGLVLLIVTIAVRWVVERDE